MIFIFSCSEKKKGYEFDCNSEKTKAQNDFKYKNYSWTDFRGLSFGLDAFSNKYFAKRLEKFHIKLDSIGLSCIISDNEKYENCYSKEMNSLLEKKFGKSFFEEQTNLAIKDFVLENKSKDPFGYEHCDDISRYPNSTIENQFDKIETDYFINYPIPKNYIEKTNEEQNYSYTSAEFTITKFGKIEDLKIESSFQNKHNKIFENAFNKQVEKFVQNVNWIPGKIQGIEVNSYYGLTIHYK